MNKKAVDLTINTVVVAILAVLVLVVLFYVFTGKVGIFSKQLNTCPGDCVFTEDECESAGGTALFNAKYLDNTGKACIICCTVQVPNP